MSEQEFNLDKKHPDYTTQEANWKKYSDCFEGGDAIQEAANDHYLIKRSKESDGDYTVRKRRAKYYNKPGQIIETFQGHIWRKVPSRSDLPDGLKEISSDVDRQGTTANGFFRSVTEIAQVKGVCWVFIDYPVNPGQGYQSKSEEKEMIKPHGLRPYFCKFDPEEVVDWGFSANNDGSESLAYVVIREQVEAANQPFLSRETKTQYRVLKPNVIEIWEKVKIGNKDVPKLISSFPNTLGQIPLVGFYGKKIRFGVGKSSISQIVDLALELYNKHSDKDSAEYMSAFPIPFFKRCDLEGGKLKVGEGWGIVSEEPDGDFRLVEFTGSSIEALRQTEKDILQEIFDLALKQVRNTGRQRETAEGKRLDRLDATSDIQARAIDFEESEQQCWNFAAKWMELEPAKSGERWTRYNLDFDVQAMEAALVTALLDMTATGQLSTESLWSELKRGEILSSDFDPEQEKLRIEGDQDRRAMGGFDNTGSGGDGEGNSIT